LHQAANELNAQVLDFLKKTEISSEFSLELLETLFGANTICHFSPKKNQELMKIITSRMENE